jgi:osmotically-inducible protein OsmY
VSARKSWRNTQRGSSIIRSGGREQTADHAHEACKVVAARWGPKGFAVSSLKLEQAMNAIKTLKLASAALIVVASINAWPQSGGSAVTSTATQTMSKSAVREANRTLSKNVIQALSKAGVDTRNINIRAKTGAVTLAGSVTDPSQIGKAGSIANGVSGVTSVKNDLTIRKWEQ